MPVTRYPGVSSFADNSTAHQLFFGRNEDSRKLFYCIVSESLTVLFSKSGYGKTSLLQAGVFKLLREENFYPLSVRLNKSDQSPGDIILSEIRMINKQTGFEVIEGKTGTTLQNYCKDLEIWSPENKLLTPVFVLDQFEELFTLEHNFQYRTAFIKDLGDLINKSREGLISVKFIISIREDFLGHLEKLAVKIPSIFSNRFRLEPLTPRIAEEAILKPATIEIAGISFSSPKLIYEKDAVEELKRFLSLKIVDGKWIETDEVEPIQLQIVCSELEERACVKMKESGASEYVITKEELGGDEGLRRILGTFYDKQLNKLKEEKKLSDAELAAISSVIEKELIVGKRRVPLSYQSVTSRPNIREDAVRFLIDHKLLKSENYQQTTLIEISHDALVEPISQALEKKEVEVRRKEAEEKRLQAEKELEKTRLELEAKQSQLRSKNTAIGILVGSVILGILILGYSIYSLRKATLQKDLAENSIKRLVDATAEARRAKDSLEKAKDKIEINYITSLGGETTASKLELKERITADSAIKAILRDPSVNRNVNLAIQYFRKTLDDTKVWVALKDLGYNNYTNINSAINTNDAKTNGIFYGNDVALVDLKVIALTLIRAGFDLQRVANIPKSQTIQIISRKYRPGEIQPVLSVAKILSATKPSDLNIGSQY